MRPAKGTFFHAEGCQNENAAAIRIAESVMSASFFQSVKYRLFATASSLVVGMASLKLYEVYLTTELYGAVVVALQIMTYLPLLDGGFRTTINRSLLAEKDEANRRNLVVFGQTLYTWLVGAIVPVSVGTMALYSLSPTVRSAGLSGGFFLVLGVSGAVCVVGSIQMGLLIGLADQAHLFFLRGIHAWVTLVGLWIVLAMGGGIWAFPLSALAGLAVTYPPAIWRIRRRMPGVPVVRLHLPQAFWDRLRKLWGDALACFRSQLSTLLLFSLDIVLVGLLAGPVAAAGYSVLARMFTIFRNFVQASGEAAWPIVAQRGEARTRFNLALVFGNAWIYGAVAGAAVVTLRPFLTWYMGREWVAPAAVLYLVAARFFVTGTASNVTYLLYGLGEFKVISRYLERELGISVLLSLAIGWVGGMAAIAGSFLLATACGTFLPILRAYAKRAEIPTREIFGGIWWRGLAAFLLSVTVAGPVLHGLEGSGKVTISKAVSGTAEYGKTGLGPVLAGVLGCVAVVVFAAVFAWWRMPTPAGESRSEHWRRVISYW